MLLPSSYNEAVAQAGQKAPSAAMLQSLVAAVQASVWVILKRQNESTHATRL